MKILRPVRRTYAAGIAALLALPLLFFAAGCDSNGSNGGNGGNTEPTVVTSPYTDTTDVDGQPTIYVSEADAEGIGIAKELADGTVVNEVTWTSDYEYVIDDKVFVNDGQTLTIEAGTVIRGTPSTTPANASALVVARGGQIFANGTADEPIIFTAEADDLSDPGDLIGGQLRGQWGGVIILGNASLNSDPGYTFIEGLEEEEGDRGLYGCGDAFACDDANNSGVFEYVSIRHGGVAIADDNEINGLTLGGVGSATEIHHVEVLYNQDDGIEWFGGTVNTRHMIAAFCGDDGFDIDEGYRGLGQYFFLVQASDAAGNGGEHDGGTSPEGAQPYAAPHIYNATFIGSSATADLALYLRDNFAGSYYNSIFTSFPSEALEVEDLADTETDDSRARFEEELLRIEHNIFFDLGGGDTFEALVRATADNPDASFAATVATYLSENNRIADPQLPDVNPDDGTLGVLPPSGSPAYEEVGDVLGDDSGFIEQTDYVGAFGSENWAAGWTFLSQAGYF